MPDRRAEIEEATAVVRWLLEIGLDGVDLTKTHALRRSVVREAAERWPHWWRHELFGPPHRESDLPVLVEVHTGLRRSRLMRRRRETLLTTAGGRELLADSEALLKYSTTTSAATASTAMRGCSSRRCCMSTVRWTVIDWRRSSGGC